MLSYLVLPQTQGAKLLYFDYVSPFIAAHEHDIEVFIANAHERAASIGLTYVKRLIDLIREKVLGLPPPSTAQTAPPPQSYGSAAATYSANLLSRFSIPSARVPAPTTTSSDIYSLLSSAVSAAAAKTLNTTTTTTTAKDDSTPVPVAVPSDASSPTEKLSFISSQRERLTYLLSVLDRESSTITKTEKEIEADVEARALDPTADTSNLKARRNKSEHSFENIEPEDIPEDTQTKSPARPTVPGGGAKRTTSAGWLPTSWFGASATEVPTEGAQPEPEETESRGKSSGFYMGQ